MCRKLIYLICLVLVLGLFSNAYADLIAYWPLDADAQEIIAGHNGTLVSGAQFTDDPEKGRVLSVDGVNDRVEIPHSDDLVFGPSDSFTIAVWLNIRTLPGNWAGVVTKSRDISPWYGLWVTPSNQWHFVGGEGGTNTRMDVGAATTGWLHFAGVYNADAHTQTIYVDGVVIDENTGVTITASGVGDVWFGGAKSVTEFLDALIDDVRIYDHALTEEEILSVMLSGGEGYPFSSSPVPVDGALYADTWVSLVWRAGDFAVSHDVYLGENFDDVNNGTGDTFRGNQADTFIIAGFPGYPYPDGLVPGTTYYWRIVEVNDAEPNSPWKGDVWSFSIPPKTAYSPDPTEGAEFVDLNVQLSWMAGFGTKLHYIVFGEDFDEVNNTAMGVPNGTTNYTPGPLKLAKTYYWRVDEFDGTETHKGDVWSFTTKGAVSGPNPADGTVDVKPSVVLRWDAGAVAASHEVYFGTDADAVANATSASPEYKGPKALGEESYDPGKLTLNTAYYWRIDEVNGVNPDSPWAGNVWSFTTGDFFVIEDFEIYDANDNQIWFAWHDGLGAGTPDTPGYLPGNGTGSAVGDETTPSYTEETIVNGGLQSMPVAYDNNKQGYSKYSEVELTLSTVRDWTAEGVTEMSLWFRGYPGSVGSFVEGPVSTYTMIGSGTDIWDNADEFHYAYKTLTGVGSMVAKVESVDNTHNWAKAGVMIRETLDPDSVHATMVVTPAQGVSFQRRPSTGAASTSANSTTGDEVAPYWVKIERDLSGNFTAYHSTNGSTWTMQGTPENIQMSSNVYIGLAVTSHDAALTCQAVFSNVTTTGTVSPQWANQDIGIASNDAEPLYVAVSNSTGTPAVVIHDDPAATQIDTWTEWVIPLQTFADQGIVLTNVDRIAIGQGSQGNMTIPGGSGKMFIDDIRLYQPREAAE
jgi:hypothetical protein